MNEQVHPRSSYLLVDGTLAQDASVFQGEDNDRPAWLHAIYTGEGAIMGPLVIDVVLAVTDGQVEEMMSLLNVITPQLHVSWIDSALTATQLVQHLRQFSVVRSFDGALFNLRLGDCVVLSMLETVLSKTQWAELSGPFDRWSVHTREGQVRDLKSGILPETPSITPLLMSQEQLIHMAELGAPDAMLAQLSDIRHGESLPGSASEQHRWATESRRLWVESGNTDPLVLRWLTSAAVDTKGAVLTKIVLTKLLADGDRQQIRAEFLAAV